MAAVLFDGLRVSISRGNEIAEHCAKQQATDQQPHEALE